ncbi:unnamed protein product [Ceutorhynchus assimilis]|uniref:Uncharacterized protein n=1 Tax=Ceutorhynchus assimilis TaxID=467358 RepID=A0A9N9QCZ0_9CUCU|nr:unnamed protein product [Ceutorhynchus assimilis]
MVAMVLQLGAIHLSMGQQSPLHIQSDYSSLERQLKSIELQLLTYGRQPICTFPERQLFFRELQLPTSMGDNPILDSQSDNSIPAELQLIFMELQLLPAGRQPNLHFTERQLYTG